MSDPVPLPEIDQLPRTTASDVKKQGWRTVARRVKEAGSVAVTNHGEAEAVILSRDVYLKLTHRLRSQATAQAADLESLRRRFDARLAGLMAPDAAGTLRAAMDAPAALGGNVKAGTGH